MPTTRFAALPQLQITSPSPAAPGGLALSIGTDISQDGPPDAVESPVMPRTFRSHSTQAGFSGGSTISDGISQFTSNLISPALPLTTDGGGLIPPHVTSRSHSLPQSIDPRSVLAASQPYAKSINEHQDYAQMDSGAKGTIAPELYCLIFCKSIKFTGFEVSQNTVASLNSQL